MRRPRVQFSVGGIMTFVAILAIGLALGHVPIGAGSGHRPVGLAFGVVDGSTARPIAGASVQVIDTFLDNPESPPAEGTAGPDGIARLRPEFPFDVAQYLIGSSERVSFRDIWVRVEAKGFRPFVARLDDGEDWASPLPGEGRFTPPSATAPPLGLRYPPPSLITLRLQPD